MAHGVQVDAPAFGGRAQGREGVAGLDVAGGDAIAERFGDLMVKRNGTRGIEAEVHRTYVIEQ